MLCAFVDNPCSGVGVFVDNPCSGGWWLSLITQVLGLWAFVHNPGSGVGGFRS